MIRVVFLFLALSVLFGAAIYGARYLSGSRMWTLTKVATISLTASALALTVMFGLVILF